MQLRWGSSALLLASVLNAQASRKDTPVPFVWRAEKVEETYEGARFMERPGMLVLERGAVEGEGLLLLADRISYNPSTDELEALGHIRLEAPGLRLRCERLRMFWQTRVGEAYALELEVPPEWTLRSEKVLFTTLKHWCFQSVEVNGCPQEAPAWTVKVGRLDVDVDGFATMRNALVWLGKIPTPYYLPWAIYPARAQRTSGLLPPSISRDSRYGFRFGIPYYQTLGDHADVTVNPEHYSRQGTLMGGEARWQPDLAHKGSLAGQVINQRLDGMRRYRLAFQEVWQREDGWNVAADVNQASDALLEADYGRSTGNLGAASYDSSFYVGKSFSFASFSLAAAEQRTFFETPQPTNPAYAYFSLWRRAMPSAELRVYPVNFGEFYLDGGLRSGRLAYRMRFGEDQPAGQYTWRREDGYARLQGRLGQFGMIRADLQAMLRFTSYGATLRDSFFTTGNGESNFQEALANSALSPFTVDGEGLIRRMTSARLQLSGPQVGRLFETFRLFGWRGELKHVVEPFVGLTANSRFSYAARIPRFDEVDARPGVAGSAMGEQSVEVGFKQHVLGRPGKGTAFGDLLRWRTSVKFHVKPVLLPDGRTQKEGWGSLDNELDVEPDDQLRLSFRRSSEVGESAADSALSAEYRAKDGSSLSLAIFTTGLNRLLVRQRGVQLGGLKRIWDDRFRFEYSMNYALPSGGNKGRLISGQAGLAYVTPCLALTCRYSRLAIQIPGSYGRESRLDVGLTLRGFGELGPLRW